VVDTECTHAKAAFSRRPVSSAWTTLLRCPSYSRRTDHAGDAPGQPDRALFVVIDAHCGQASRRADRIGLGRPSGPEGGGDRLGTIAIAGGNAEAGEFVADENERRGRL